MNSLTFGVANTAEAGEAKTSSDVKRGTKDKHPIVFTDCYGFFLFNKNM